MKILGRLFRPARRLLKRRSGVAFVSFILAGLIQNVWLNLAIAIALMVATLFVIKAVVSKKNAGIFQEMAEANKKMVAEAK